MKPYREQTHYEILDVPMDASTIEISRAYKEAFELYREDSMATYSFFSDVDRKEILSRLEEAYITLINPESRSAYDHALSELLLIEDEKQDGTPARRPTSILSFKRQSSSYHSLPEHSLTGKSLVAENAFIQEILQRDRLSGQDLKSIRTMLGVPLERIVRQTRVMLGTLQAIEDDRFDRLPHTFYLKSYLKMYAQCLQVDASSIINGYIKHYESGK